jgi:malonyl-CoA/methylmalonyl-CoA synthetase
MNNQNLYSLFQANFPTQENAVFIKADSGNVSYADIDPMTGRIQSMLKSHGVKKGDRVIVQVEKSTDAVLLYLACLRAGAIYIPLNTGYTATEVRYFLSDAEPQMFVVAPENEADLKPVAEELQIPYLFTLGTRNDGSLIAALPGQPIDNSVTACDGDDLAAILYTSGTTGRSKGAMLSHDNLASNAICLHEMWGFVPGDVLLHCLPIYHVHGLFVALHCALLNGSKVIFREKYDAEEVTSLLPEASVFMGVPTFFTRLLDTPGFGRESCRNIRLFVAGSAPLLAETFELFAERTGHRILERYGMTEAGMITSNPYNGERLAGTVGFPLPGVNARVADENGQEVSHGDVGVLEISGPNLFKGYWRKPDKTAEEFRPDGFFITGDMAIMAADGRISIIGRAKDLVISGGLNVYPKEIETLIDELEGVNESAVFGLPHPDFGEGVTAAVVTDGSVELDEDKVLFQIIADLAKFKQPKRVFFLDELPRNAMGKVQKADLRERRHL